MADGDQQQDAVPQSGDGIQVEPSIGFDVDALFAAGVDAPASAEPASEPEASPPGDEPGIDATGDEDLPDEADADEDAADEPAAADDTPPEQRLFEFASIVAQNPNRISEVPARERPEVIKSLLQAAYLRGQQDTDTQFQQQSSAEERLRTFVSERGEARRADPDGFSQWEQDNPADAARYHQGVAHFKEKAAPPAADSSTGDPAAIQQRANAKLARVSALPDGARQQFVARVQSGEFPLSEAGLDAMDDALFAAAAAAQAAATAAPAAAAAPTAVRRQAAAAARAEAPRPKGVGTGGQPVPEQIYDPDRLFAMA